MAKVKIDSVKRYLKLYEDSGLVCYLRKAFESLKEKLDSISDFDNATTKAINEAVENTPYNYHRSKYLKMVVYKKHLNLSTLAIANYLGIPSTSAHRMVNNPVKEEYKYWLDIIENNLKNKI